MAVRLHWTGFDRSLQQGEADWDEVITDFPQKNGQNIFSTGVIYDN